MAVRFSRAICGLALLIVATIAWGPAAFASGAYPPPPSCGTVAVTTTVPGPGDDVTLDGSGFLPGSKVTITLTHASVQADVGEVVTSSTGTFAFDVHLPANASGSYRLSTIGGVPPGCVVDPVTLTVGSGTSPGGHLAHTGAAVLALVAIAGVLLASGALFAATGRRGHTYVGSHR
jgi:hypothetical protein